MCALRLGWRRHSERWASPQSQFAGRTLCNGAAVAARLAECDAVGRSAERERTGSAERERTGSAERERTGSTEREGTGSAERERTGSAEREGTGGAERDGT